MGGAASWARGGCGGPAGVLSKPAEVCGSRVSGAGLRGKRDAGQVKSATGVCVCVRVCGGGDKGSGGKLALWDRQFLRVRVMCLGMFFM